MLLNYSPGRIGSFFSSLKLDYCSQLHSSSLFDLCVLLNEMVELYSTISRNHKIQVNLPSVRIA
jgi:hypothetical protein